ncbi:MAG: protein-disulfide reductase DsbD [Pseudomonadota bacterium]
MKTALSSLLLILAGFATPVNANLAASGEDLLPPEQAFSVVETRQDNGDLNLFYNIAPDYYLYQKRLRFVLDDGREITPELPSAETYPDPFEGPTPIYRHSLDIDIEAAELSGSTLTAHFQGCADIGVCYPPQKSTIELGGQPASQAAAPTGAAESEQDRYARWIGERQIGWVVASFFGLGLLLALTPCVFPMIPILTTMVVGQKRGNGASAFVLSTVYVLAMALAYTVAGVLVGLGGANIQAALQHPLVIGTIAALFVVLALAMFGAFNLQMPAAIQSRLNALSQRQRGGSLWGAAVLGVLSALIVGPCVTAPLIGALIYISQTGDPVLGGLALFALGLGMGAPLIAIGTGAGAWMPQAGPWMNAIKHGFGVLMLATAIWMLDRVVPIQTTVLLSSALLLGIGVALWPSRLDSATARARLAGALLALLYAAALAIGALSGQPGFSQPLAGLGGSPANQPEQRELAFKPIKTVDDLEVELQAAAERNQPVMLDFYADWCVSCKEMEHFTFSDPAVQSALGDWQLLQADVTANDARDQALLRSLGLFGPPAILFYLPGETGMAERGEARTVGYVPASDFALHIDQLNAILASP